MHEFRNRSVRSCDYKVEQTEHCVALIMSAIFILKGALHSYEAIFKITEIETLINITYIVRFLRSTDVSVFYY